MVALNTASVILWLIVVYLAIVEPIVGQRMYQRLLDGRQSRMRFYRVTMWWEWGLTFVVVAIYLIAGIPLRLLGLYNPNGFFFPSGTLGGVFIGVIVGLAVGSLLSAITSKRRRRPTARIGRFDAILPRTSRERTAFVGVALTAGICEEILFRGMVVYIVNHQFPNAFPIMTIVVSAVIFGIAHAYQGWAGILGTGILGALFTAIFLSTGALWIPMILHVIIDMRALLLRPATAQQD